MSNSKLIDYTLISPNKTSPRNHVIDTITIHCVVGQLSAEDICGCFRSANSKASCNYGIGTDGRIALCVEEKDRSWCSSNAANDNRAITIECASDKTHPYAINDAVYKSLINLCEDICRRNKIKSLKWKADKSLIGQVDKQNMTVHRWFANKACPGDYIYERLGEIAAEVNLRLGVDMSELQNGSYPEVPFDVKVIVDDLNYRSEPKMGENIEGQTGKGVFTITKVESGWGKLKSGAGWIWLGNPEYCTIIEKKSDVPFSVKVSIRDLNIRTGPGINYSRTGKFTGVGTFTITKVESGSGSTKGWGKLKSGAGWISLDYAKKVE